MTTPTSPGDILRAARAKIAKPNEWTRTNALDANNIIKSHERALYYFLVAEDEITGRRNTRAFSLRWIDRAIALADGERE